VGHTKWQQQLVEQGEPQPVRDTGWRGSGYRGEVGKDTTCCKCLGVLVEVCVTCGSVMQGAGQWREAVDASG
jgi:hypothetical protein